MTSLDLINDIGCAIAVVTANIICWTGSRRIATRYFPSSNYWLQLSVRLVLIWATIDLAAIALGLLQVLSTGRLYLLVVGVWAFAWVLGIHPRNAVSEGKTANRQSLELALKHRSKLDCFQVGMVLLSSVGLAQTVQMSVITLPYDWDTLAYHLPLVDSWLQTGSILNQRCAFWYVPGNNEILALWFGGMFSGDYWAQLHNVPVVVLLVSSLIAVSRELRLARFWQITVIFAAMSCTPVLRQLSSAGNDVAVASLFLTATLFCIRLCGKRHSVAATLFLLSVTVGLLAGVKYYALGYAAAIVLVVAIYCFYKFNIGFAFQATFSMLAGCMLYGGPWYFRNWVLTGSPLFPKGFPALGIPDAWETLRPNLLSSCLLFGSTAETTWLLAQAWLAQTSLLMAIAASFVIPIAILYFSLGHSRLALLNTNYHRIVIARPLNCASSKAATVVRVIALLALFTYVCTPNVIETEIGSRNMLKAQIHSVRFGYTFGTISVVVLVHAISRIKIFSAGRCLGTRFTYIFFAFFSALSLVWVLLPQYGLRNWIHLNIARVWLHQSLDVPITVWGLITLDFIILVLCVRRCNAHLHGWAPALALALPFVVATPFLSAHWHRTFNVHYSRIFGDSIGEFITSHFPSGACICACEYQYYRFLGSRRENEVYRPRSLTSREQFAAFLRENKVQLVIVPISDKHWSRAYQDSLIWIRELPDFEKIMQQGNMVLFARVFE